MNREANFSYCKFPTKYVSQGVDFIFPIEYTLISVDDYVIISDIPSFLIQ